MMKTKSLLSKLICLSLLVAWSFSLIPRSIADDAEAESVTSDWQPNGRIIAYITEGKLQLFDTVLSQNLNIIQSLPTNIFVTAWSPDGTKLAASDDKGSVYVWRIADDASTAKLVAILQSFDDTVTSLAWNVASNKLAGARWDGKYTVQVWDIDTLKPIFRAETGNTYRVSWKPVDNMLAISTIGGLYSVDFDKLSDFSPMDFANFKDFAKIATQIGPSDEAVPIAWSPDGMRVATGNFEGTIRVINVVTETEEASLKNTDTVTALAWDATGSYLTGAIRDQKVLVWSTHTYQIISDFPTGARVLMLSFSPFGGRLVFGDFSKTTQPNAFVNGAIRTVVPDPSIERLQAIADLCNAPTAVRNLLTPSATKLQLGIFSSRVGLLPAGTIPSACAADLVAVANALQSQ